MLKIVRVVLHLGKSQMYVLCTYNGFRRNVRYEWKQKIQSDVPPDNWVELVKYEMDDAWSRSKRPGLPFPIR